MKAGDYDFYFGYEYSICPKHGNDSSECLEEYCNKSEWAFVVKKGKEEIFRGTSPTKYCEPAEDLLACIGKYWDKIEEAIRNAADS
jgi:hypothetical protein